MTVRFLDELLVRVVDDEVNELIAPFRSLVKEAGQPDSLIEVPTGFITNFASVPRKPLLYMLYGGRGRKEATVHDYLYAVAERPRNWCDAVFHHALLANPKIDKDIADQMYLGVRLGGDDYYGKTLSLFPLPQIGARV